jgi:hypothetical protein
LGKIKTFAGNVLRRFKFLFIVLSIVTLTTVILSQTSMSIQRGKFKYILTASRCPKEIPWQFTPGRRQ